MYGKVLVVDEEIEFLQIMRKFLKDAGFQVVTALNVMDMGEKLKVGELPKIIFLDVMMPEIDGWKVAELLKSDKKYKDIPICILTAKTTTLDAITSLEIAKANWHLNKPVTKRQILDTVDMVLSGKLDR